MNPDKLTFQALFTLHGIIEHIQDNRWIKDLEKSEQDILIELITENTNIILTYNGDHKDLLEAKNLMPEVLKAFERFKNRIK